jgi:hypothetical protein
MGVLERLLGAIFQYVLWYYRYSSLECASPAFILAFEASGMVYVHSCVVVDAATAPFKSCLDGNVDSLWQKMHSNQYLSTLRDALVLSVVIQTRLPVVMDEGNKVWSIFNGLRFNITVNSSYATVAQKH